MFSMQEALTTILYVGFSIQKAFRHKLNWTETFPHRLVTLRIPLSFYISLCYPTSWQLLLLEMRQSQDADVCMVVCLKFWVDYHMHIITYCWELMESVGSHGSSSMMAMVWHFVSDTHKVMTVPIHVVLVLILPELTGFLPLKCCLGSLLCNLLDIFFLLFLKLRIQYGCYSI
jgi:hypothetical protein